MHTSMIYNSFFAGQDLVSCAFSLPAACWHRGKQFALHTTSLANMASTDCKYRIVLLRHGESDWNKLNKFCGWHGALLPSLVLCSVLKAEIALLRVDQHAPMQMPHCLRRDTKRPRVLGNYSRRLASSSMWHTSLCSNGPL